MSETDYLDEPAVNPFIWDLQINVIRGREAEEFVSKDSIHASDDTVNLREGYKTKEETYTYYFDGEENCKVFRNESAKTIIEGLSASQLQLFSYIILHLGRNRDRIRLEMERCCEELQFGEKTFYRAVSALSRYAVIQRFKKNIYWINPAILFNGNRIKKYPEKVKVIVTLGDPVKDKKKKA